MPTFVVHDASESCGGPNLIRSGCLTWESEVHLVQFFFTISGEVMEDLLPSRSCMPPPKEKARDLDQAVWPNHDFDKKSLVFDKKPGTLTRQSDRIIILKTACMLRVLSLGLHSHHAPICGPLAPLHFSRHAAQRGLANLLPSNHWDGHYVRATACSSGCSCPSPQVRRFKRADSISSPGLPLPSCCG